MKPTKGLRTKITITKLNTLMCVTSVTTNDFISNETDKSNNLFRQGIG